jgi:hypothetical protein
MEPDSDSPADPPIFAAMRKPREVIRPARWGVYLLKRKAERLSFTVTGRNSDETLARALKEHDLTKHAKRRLSVQREA